MTKPLQVNPETLNCQRTAAELHCSTRKIYDLYDSDELLGYKIGAKRIIYRTSIVAFRERHRNGKRKMVPVPPPPLPKKGPYEFLNF